MAKITDWKHFWISLISKVFAAIIAIGIVLYSGMIVDHQSLQWVPDYEQQSIDEIILKTELSQEDYDVIYKQTGITKVGVDNLISNDKLSLLVDLQKQLFEHKEVVTDMFAPFICQHEVGESLTTVPLRNGDIIVTDTTHLSFFTIGHAAMVIDAKNGLVLNAIGYDSKSQVMSIDEMINRPNMIILRPKLSEDECQNIVDYALTELHNKDYSITVGILSEKFPDEIQKTHCSHMIWAAYKHAGIDLDVNGGAVVMPMDLVSSEYVDIIQIYGFDLDLYK